MSINKNNAKFLTLNQKIFSGDKQVGRIYVGTEQVYPKKGLRCWIAVYPKREYYVGEAYDWTNLVIKAENDTGEVFDVTEKFRLSPAHGDHCKKEGVTVVECTWIDVDETYILYFDTKGILKIEDEPFCWIDRFPRLLYWDHESFELNGLVILGAYLDGRVEDVTKYFTSTPKVNSKMHLHCHISSPADSFSDIGKRIEVRTCTLTSKYLPGETRTFTFDYKVLPRYMHEVSDLYKYLRSDLEYKIPDPEQRWFMARRNVPSYSEDAIVRVHWLTPPLSSVKQLTVDIFEHPPKYIWFEYSRDSGRKYSIFAIYFADENFNTCTITYGHYEIRPMTVKEYNPETGKIVDVTKAVASWERITDTRFPGGSGGLYPTLMNFDRDVPYVWEKLGVPPA